MRKTRRETLCAVARRLVEPRLSLDGRYAEVPSDAEWLAWRGAIWLAMTDAVGAKEMRITLAEELREYADAVDKDRARGSGLTDCMRDAADELDRV